MAVDERILKEAKKGAEDGRKLAAAHHAGNGKAVEPVVPSPPVPEPWEPIIPFGGEYSTPPLPMDCFPPWLADWIAEEAEAKQTPPDLGAMLALAICGAALARKFVVEPCAGWREPLNLYTVVSLPPGDRKSAVFRDAMAPLEAFQKMESERLKHGIAETASAHRVMEARLKDIESRAAKSKEDAERTRLEYDARELAKEIIAHHVIVEPQLVCDDVTPEKLGNLLAKHGGKILQASPEGTLFEIAKGRYSDSANFDVYLKGHAGDLLRIGRISRESDTVEDPALSVAVAVQPDIISGLSEQSSMRGRGFLARFTYCLPVSRLGERKIRPVPVRPQVSERYHNRIIDLWKLLGKFGPDGKPVPHVLEFCEYSERALAEFETWLEPQLGEVGKLSLLAGWANKLSGVIVRVAGILHACRCVGNGQDFCDSVVGIEAVNDAIRLGRDYFLPHAKAAFGLMDDDQDLKDARRAVSWLSNSESVNSVKGIDDFHPGISERDLHAGVFGGTRKLEDIRRISEILYNNHFIRYIDISLYIKTKSTRGRKPSPRFEVNPSIHTFKQLESRNDGTTKVEAYGQEGNSGNLSHNSHIHRIAETKGDAFEG